jgi:hypothetical protein
MLGGWAALDFFFAGSDAARVIGHTSASKSGRIRSSCTAVIVLNPGVDLDAEPGEEHGFLFVAHVARRVIEHLNHVFVILVYQIDVHGCCSPLTPPPSQPPPRWRWAQSDLVHRLFASLGIVSSPNKSTCTRLRPLRSQSRPALIDPSSWNPDAFRLDPGSETSVLVKTFRYPRALAARQHAP